MFSCTRLLFFFVIYIFGTLPYGLFRVSLACKFIYVAYSYLWCPMMENSILEWLHCYSFWAFIKLSSPPSSPPPPLPHPPNLFPLHHLLLLVHVSRLIMNDYCLSCRWTYKAMRSEGINNNWSILLAWLINCKFYLLD